MTLKDLCPEWPKKHEIFETLALEFPGIANYKKEYQIGWWEGRNLALAELAALSVNFDTRKIADWLARVDVGVGLDEMTMNQQELYICQAAALVEKLPELLKEK